MEEEDEGVPQCRWCDAQGVQSPAAASKAAYNISLDSCLLYAIRIARKFHGVAILFLAGSVLFKPQYALAVTTFCLSLVLGPSPFATNTLHCVFGSPTVPERQNQ